MAIRSIVIQIETDEKDESDVIEDDLRKRIGGILRGAGVRQWDLGVCDEDVWARLDENGGPVFEKRSKAAGAGGRA